MRQIFDLPNSFEYRMSNHPSLIRLCRLYMTCDAACSKLKSILDVFCVTKFAY